MKLTSPTHPASRALALIAFATVLTLLLATQPSMQGSDEMPDDEAFLGESDDEDRIPDVPKEVLSEFLNEVKSSQYYAIAKRLTVEDVEVAAHQLSSELGWDVEVRINSFWRENVLENDELYSHNYTLYLDDIEVGEFYKDVILLQHNEENEEFIVHHSLLEELDFPFAAEVTIKHPLNEIKEHFSAVNRPLSMLVDDLCSEGDIDYAIRSDLAGEINLNLSLRGRSVLECLEFAAQAAGWQVKLTTKEEPIVWLRDSSVYTFDDIGEIWANREILNLRLGEDSPWRIETPVDALRYRVWEEGLSMKRRKYAAVIEPREEAPAAKTEE